MTTPNGNGQLQKLSLPATSADLKRRSRRNLTTADYIEESGVFPKLYDTPEFKRLLDAVTNREAAEGSIWADDFTAALMIRNAAPEESPLKDMDGEEVARGLRVFLKRWNLGRQQRLVAIEA